MSLKFSICVAKNTNPEQHLSCFGGLRSTDNYIENQRAITGSSQSQREAGSQRPRPHIDVMTKGPAGYEFPFPMLLPVPSDCETEHSFLTPHKGRALKQAPNPLQRF